MSINIVPYNNSYDQSIAILEQEIVQGRQIKLRILKQHFLDRSSVFPKFYPCVAIEHNTKLVGTVIGTQTAMILNETQFNAGFGIDLKVHPAYRNKGIAKMMIKHLYKNFFEEEMLTKNFITSKSSNTPLIRLVTKLSTKVWLYDFVYLTIPTKVRIDAAKISNPNQELAVTLFNKENLPPGYFTSFADGLSYFHTYRLYRLSIQQVSFVYQQGINLLKKVKKSKYAFLPAVNEVMEFATLYNHRCDNIHHLNEVLLDLERNGKSYLLVCCRKNDSIYNYLKKYSINTYGYNILSDFALHKNDKITIDVRCL